MKRVGWMLLAAPLLVAAAPVKDWKAQALASAAPFIDKANDEWSRAIVTGDADVMSAPYAADGVFIGHDGAETRGRDAVREMYAKRPASVKVLKASIRSDGRVAADPDDVYEWGSALITVKRGGAQPRSVEGRYLTVWHHAGAKWVITHNIAF